MNDSDFFINPQSAIRNPESNTLGMVIAGDKNLWRLEAYGLKRGEFGIYERSARDKLLDYITTRKLNFSIHTPLFVPTDYPENPLLACLVDCDEDRRRGSVALMIESIEMAVEYGAEFVVVHVQRPEKFAGCGPDSFTEQKAMDAALRSAEALVESSSRTGVPVLIENIMDNSVFYRVEHYMNIFDHFPGLNFCFDVGHLDMDARRFGIDFMEFVQALAPRTREVHLQNSVGPTHPTAPRPWKIPVHPSQHNQEGWCDIQTTLKTVLTARPDCVINLEFAPDKEHDTEFIMQGINWIRDYISGILGNH